MTREQMLEGLRSRLSSSRNFSERADEIVNRVAGKEQIRAGVNIEIERAKDKSAPNGEAYHILIKASTDGIARDAGVIPMEAWRDGGLANFNDNPVILAFHNHRELPIGISVFTELTSRQMNQYWRFHGETELSRTMRKLYEGGYMRAASVGFIVREFKFIDEMNDNELATLVEKYGPSAVRDIYWVATRAELLETSAVPVPSDPGALKFEEAARSAQAVGIDITSLQEVSRMPTRTAAMPEVPATPPAPAPDGGDSSGNRQPDHNEIAELRSEVSELRGIVEAQQTELARLAEAFETRETPVAPAAPAVPETPATPADDEVRDSVQISLDVREGETVDQAFERYVDEKARSLMGAPIVKK